MGNRQAHILIVEDSEDDRNMYAYYLTCKGYRVSKAHDGKEGLEKAYGLEPDLILLDLWLPKMSGWEVMQRLKASKGTNRIPVLVVTGHSSARPRECDGLLTKPCPPELVNAEIGRILEPPDKVKGLSPVTLPIAHPDVVDENIAITQPIPDPISN